MKRVIGLRYTPNISHAKNVPTRVQNCVIKAIEISHVVKETAGGIVQQAETSSKLTSAQTTNTDRDGEIASEHLALFVFFVIITHLCNEPHR